MTLDVDIITRDLPHVIVIGNDAIRRDPGDKPYVYVVRDGRTVKTPISVGSANETQTVVTRGLSPGMVIVNDRNAGIGPNALVTQSAIATPQPQAGRRRRVTRFAAYFGEALEAIWRNRTRSLLTMLGMVIGTASIIAVLGLSRAASAESKRRSIRSAMPG